MVASVEALHRRAAADPSCVALAGGLPSPELFPREELAVASRRALQRDGESALQYSWPEGREKLRAWVCARLARRGVTIAPDEVIVTNGAQQGIYLATTALLREGESVALDAASYPGAIDCFRGSGTMPVALGERARCAYVMPAIANPTGRVMLRRERDKLLAWAGSQCAHVIEDDAYAELMFNGDAPAPLLSRDRERVWYTGSLSKVLCPGLRVGWLIPPPDRRAAVLERKRVCDLQGNGLAQSIVEHFLATDDFDARLATARAHYQRRCTALMAAVRRDLASWEFEAPAGGFSIWLRAPDPIDERALLERAIACGVSFDPGASFHAIGTPRSAVRLSYSFESESRIAEGVRRLARAWTACRRERPRLP